MADVPAAAAPSINGLVLDSNDPARPEPDIVVVAVNAAGNVTFLSLSQL